MVGGEEGQVVGFGNYQFASELEVGKPASELWFG